MATESVTKVVEFDHAPAYPCGMFQVNAGIDASFAVGDATVLLQYVRNRLVDGVASPLDSDEARVLALLADMSNALFQAAGVEE